MDSETRVVHGRHRKRDGRRAALMALALGLVAAGTLALVLWPGGPAWFDSDQAASSSSPATSHAGHDHGTRTAASPTSRASSVSTPDEGRAVPVGKAPHFMAIAPDGSFGYIADPVAGAVIRFDIATDRPTVTIPVPEAPPQMVTFSPDGRRAYVSAYNEDFSTDVVVTLDAVTDEKLDSVKVGHGPYAAATTPDGRRLYVPYYDENFFDVLDAESGARLARVPAAACPHWIVFSSDGRTAYTTNHFSDVVSVVRVSDNSIQTTIPVGDGPHSLELSPDGTRLAVVNYIGGDVTLIDTARNAVVGTVPGVGAGPQDVTYAPDGRHLYTANVDDGTVAVVDTESQKVTARIATGTSPTSVAVTPDGRSAFVTNFDDGTVTVLDIAGS
jgi:YVTN family beta-propeller protein